MGRHDTQYDGSQHNNKNVTLSITSINISIKNAAPIIMTVIIKTLRMMTIIIKTLRMMIIIIKTLRMMTIFIMTLNITIKNAPLSIKKFKH
jgi:hypothetical protein